VARVFSSPNRCSHPLRCENRLGPRSGPARWHRPGFRCALSARRIESRFHLPPGFELDVRAGELRKHGIRLRLREQPLRILLLLLENPGEIVVRGEIRSRLWPNETVVEFDHGINAAVKKLRAALGESAEQPRYIETVARRGYRFLGEVKVVEAPSSKPQNRRVPTSTSRRTIWKASPFPTTWSSINWAAAEWVLSFGRKTSSSSEAWR